MSLAASYPWLKALHVASALIFAGGVLATAVFLAAAGADSRTMAAAARSVRRWDQAVTTPAMLLVWGFGLALAVSGNWFGQIWLSAKLVFVIILSGIHGIQSGRLRRFEGGAEIDPLRTGPIILGCLIVIAILAVVKPG